MPEERSESRLFVRASIAFLALPGLVAFAVPLWLVFSPAVDQTFQWLGLLPLGVGAALLLWCVRDFYVAGRGTLAPWDPPRELVVSGAYRFSRNPMYAAIVLILLGWAIGFGSAVLGGYALAVGIGFHLRIVFGEEPWLARTHGPAWARYTERVPRWVGLPRSGFGDQSGSG